MRARVTIVGDEPHLPYERPPLSKAAMISDDEPLPTYCVDAKRASEHDIVHHANAPAVSIDRGAHAVRLAEGRAIPYERLLIATGAQPRRLNVPGAEHALYLRSFADALALRRQLKPGARVAIIGGGFIGLELAASAVARGARVTVIEALPRLLSRAVPEAIAERVRERHASAGVVFHVGVGVDRIEAEGESRVVVLSNGVRVGCER